MSAGSADVDRIVANLMLSRAYAETRSVVVASSVRGEGCTTVALQMTRSFARERSSRVILVDACFRAPQLHKLLGVMPRATLAGALQGQYPLQQAVVPVGEPDEAGNFGFIPAGAIAPDGLPAGWPTMLRRLLAELAQDGSRVLVDVGAVIALPEAALVANACDGAVFVVRAGAVRTRLAIAARTRLVQAQPNVLGVVLNRTRHVIPGWLYRRV